MRLLIGIFGTGGFAKEVLPLLRRQMQCEGVDGDVVFVSPDSDGVLNGVSVWPERDFLRSSRRRASVIAIANPKIRKRLFEMTLDGGAEPMGVVSKSAELLDVVDLGSGAILCSHSLISSNTRVGTAFHLNVGSYLAHDCVVGDFVTFGPGVLCAGNVIIEDGAYIGGGARLRQGKPGEPMVIGASAVVGMGAVVTKSVRAGVVVAGNPARELR